MMSAGACELAAIQRWLLETIRQPTGVDPRDEQVSAVIAPSSRQTSAERLQVYADAYFARLLEVLKNEYPALAHALGDDLFAEFMLGFLQTSPSTSYTLSDLGARFPNHLYATRPLRQSETPDWADFLIDCSRLERLYAEVFDGPGPERDSAPRNRSLSDGLSVETFTTLRLQVAPWVRLISLQFPIHEYVTAVRKGQSPELPPPRVTHLVVSRREFLVRRVPVSAAEFQLLHDIQSGQTVGAALQRLLSNSESAAVTAGTIEQWFHAWTSAGYFVGQADGSPESRES